MTLAVSPKCAFRAGGIFLTEQYWVGWNEVKPNTKLKSKVKTQKSKVILIIIEKVGFRRLNPTYALRTKVIFR